MLQESVIAEAEAENKGLSYETELISGDHFYIADEPQESGGEDSGPSPASLVCASLASCKAITLRMYAKRKGWKVDLIKVKVTLSKAEDGTGVAHTFFCSVNITGELDEEQNQRMLKIADACPVHKLLTGSSSVSTSLIA